MWGTSMRMEIFCCFIAAALTDKVWVAFCLFLPPLSAVRRRCLPGSWLWLGLWLKWGLPSCLTDDFQGKKHRQAVWVSEHLFFLFLYSLCQSSNSILNVCNKLKKNCKRIQKWKWVEAYLTVNHWQTAGRTWRVWLSNLKMLGKSCKFRDWFYT